MSKFLSGREVIEKLGIEEFEILEYIQRGLIPYDKAVGQPAFEFIYGDLKRALFELIEAKNSEGRNIKNVEDIVDSEIEKLKALLQELSRRGLAGLYLPAGHPAISGKISYMVIECLIQNCCYREEDILCLQTAPGASIANNKGNGSLPSFIPQSRRDKQDVREYARDTWSKDPKPRTTAAMIDLVKKNPEWNPYADKTIREWIAPDHPDYVPGRKGRRPQ